MTYSKEHGRYSGEDSEFQKGLLDIVANYDKDIAEAKAKKDAFDELWKTVRCTVIKPVFKETEDRLSSRLNVSHGEENGCSYILRNINRHFLKYTADQEKDRIVCSGSGLAEDNAEFEFSLLKRDHVEAHVKMFVDFCLRHQAD
jgi:hypothetical protein